MGDEKPATQALHDYLESFYISLRQAAERVTSNQYEQIMAIVHRQSPLSWFVVGSKIYGPNQKVYAYSQVNGADTVPGLPAHAMDYFREWESSLQNMERDLVRVKQTIGSILTRGKTWQDIRNMFPDHVLKSFPAGIPLMEMLPRTCSDLNVKSSHVWDSQLVNMYARISGLIDLYLGYKLL